ncbi:unnamed protein product [Gordionus sp. m RMFG-2023]
MSKIPTDEEFRKLAVDAILKDVQIRSVKAESMGVSAWVRSKSVDKGVLNGTIKTVTTHNKHTKKSRI